jgi:hypothetical protein
MDSLLNALLGPLLKPGGIRGKSHAKLEDTRYDEFAASLATFSSDFPCFWEAKRQKFGNTRNL